MIILLDQDGPLADFEGGFLKQWRAKFPNGSILFLIFHTTRMFPEKEESPGKIGEVF